MIYTDILAEIDSLCDTNSTSYTTADKTRRVNIALETLVSKIIIADGTWEFDDRNFTTLPIATTTLVAAQQDYAFDITQLDVLRVEVKDINGIWQKLEPIDNSKIDVAIDEFYKTDGLPLYYDKQASSILLYPAPSAADTTLTSGLKVYFQRTADLFSTSDTTKVAGLASPYHYLLAFMAALPYCKTYKKDRVIQLERDIATGIEDMILFYSRRSKDERHIMTPKAINFI